MKMSDLPGMRIGDLVSKLPIIQGGMGIGVSGVCLASAVANEGGVGVLSSAVMGFDIPGTSVSGPVMWWAARTA